MHIAKFSNKAAEKFLGLIVFLAGNFSLHNHIFSKNIAGRFIRAFAAFGLLVPLQVRVSQVALQRLVVTHNLLIFK